MTTRTAHALPARASARRSLAWRRGAAGMLYAAPTAVIVVVFFLVPLVLVFWMSANRWRILGSPTFNFPDNYTKIPDNELFLDSVTFTLKYTAITTVLLSGIALALAMSVQNSRPGVTPSS